MNVCDFDSTAFSRREKAARMAAGLSQNKLSEETGLHRNTIANYEKGLQAPAADSLAALCTVLNVSADWLLGLDES